MATRSIPRVARRAKVLTLADIAAVTRTIGSRTTKVSGAELVALIDATRHLYDPESDTSDFIDATCIAIELNGMAEVLTELGKESRVTAHSYLSDQLRRLSHRVAALAPRAGNSAADWYKVEVTR